MGNNGRLLGPDGRPIGTSPGGIDSLSVPGTPSIATSEDQVRPLRSMEVTFRAFEAAEREISTALGVPLCIEGCGKCCEVSTPVVNVIETQMLASYLLGMDPATLSKILTICDGWLLDRDSRLTIYNKADTTRPVTVDEWARLQPEVNSLLNTMPCPMLAPDTKRCLVHEMRPLACRAYGVTHVPHPWCPRPLSAMESDEARGHVHENSLTGQKLRRMVHISIEQDTNGVRFLPTAIYSLLNPNKLNEYAESNLIASAKLVVLLSNPSIIFQSQLSALWEKDPTGNVEVKQS